MESIAHGAPVATTVLVSFKEAHASTFTTLYPIYYALPVYYIITSGGTASPQTYKGALSAGPPEVISAESSSVEMGSSGLSSPSEQSNISRMAANGHDWKWKDLLAADRGRGIITGNCSSSV